MDEEWFIDDYKVAVDELALFFNNNTINHGWKQLRPGMTKDEAKQALQQAGFDALFADAFLKKMYNNANLYWENGKLHLPEGWDRNQEN